MLIDVGKKLVSLQLNYNQGNSNLGAAPQYEGNIASLTWQHKGGQTQAYGYQYDFLNRLTEANYNLNSNAYRTTYGYDARGNILSLTRNGVYRNGANFQAQEIDNLQYTPVAGTNKIQKISDNAPCPANKVVHQTLDNTQLHAVDNQLMADNAVNDNATITYQAGTSVTLMPGFHAKVGTDFLAKIEDCPQSGFETDGFTQRSNGNYDYDANGNQTIDPNKGITVLYNYHNLPYKVTFDNGNTIEWLYTGDGTKRQKTIQQFGNNTPLLIQDYLGGIEYRNDTLEALYFEIGRLFFEDNAVHYEYSLKDHLGNSRVLFSDKNGNGAIEDTEVSDISSFYPFGLRHKGGDIRVNETQDYLYNGKELDTDFGLNWYHYGFRMYDPAVGRFTGVDPISDVFPELSTFNYASNDPIKNIDLHGLQGTRADIRLNQRNQRLLEGKISKQEFIQEGISEGIGGVLGAAVVFGGPAAITNPFALETSATNVGANFFSDAIIQTGTNIVNDVDVIENYDVVGGLSSLMANPIIANLTDGVFNISFTSIKSKDILSSLDDAIINTVVGGFLGTTNSKMIEKTNLPSLDIAGLNFVSGLSTNSTKATATDIVNEVKNEDENEN